MYIYFFHIIGIIYKYFKCIQLILKRYTFLKYMHVCVVIYIYIINIHHTHTYIVNKNFYFGCD